MEYEVSMPVGAGVIAAQMQHRALCLWAEVDPEKPMERRPFMVIGTGHTPVPEYGVYIGTVQDGNFVWHVYDLWTDPHVLY